VRILYTFQKEKGHWIVTCPSDKSSAKITYNSLIEAINKFFVVHDDVEYFDIVIPSTVPTPIQFKKNIRVKRLPGTKKPIKPARNVKNNSQWAIVTKPYDEQNILIVHDPFRNRNIFNSRLRK
jgi:hypothetical protein